MKINGKNILLHGADYNPDQWLECPDILRADIELMKKAHINCVSVGIFAWARLEPQEGVYDFDWLESIINELYKNGIYSLLATPSAAKPFWMSEKYPEICFTDINGDQHHGGVRANFCMSSPVYREFVRKIDEALAKRFADNPAVIMWHIGNEFCSTKCYCEKCCHNFKEWLKTKYGDIETLNKAWWTDFWAHRYSSFDEIHPPMPTGEPDMSALNLDWMRFTEDNTLDFIKMEVEAVHKYSDLPTTTNLMGFFEYNYTKLAEAVDYISWDSYPFWHSGDDIKTAAETACTHDYMRSITPEKPFLLMESTPSSVNWSPVTKLKKPHTHYAASMQAVAHGSDSVQYFQWRKSRGSNEKFHGAVVDHFGGENRVFNDVRELGEKLSQYSEIAGSSFKSEIALLYDHENRTAIKLSQGPRNCNDGYMELLFDYHAAFWKMGVNTDIINMTQPFDKYKVIIAPMLYMMRGGVEEKLREFVKNGGICVMTVQSGWVDENDLAYLGGWPHGLMEVFGIWDEETDALWDGEFNTIIPKADFLSGEYKAERLCALIHAKSAEPLAVYGDNFYKDMPVLTRNNYGKGTAYYVAAITDRRFLDDFTRQVLKEANIKRNIDIDLPNGVTVHKRVSDNYEYLFVQNFSGKELTLDLKREYETIDGNRVSSLDMLDYDVKILKVKI